MNHSSAVAEHRQPDSLALPARWLLLARLLPVLFALACFLLSMKWSWHWPIVHDAAIMHYVVFLMDHGMAPYRDIIDINMPGAYMIEWAVVHTFGDGAMAWRLFDLCTMLVALGACCWIAAPYDWLAGAFSGLALAVFHISNGAIELGQRDWTMMVLVLLGYAFLFHAIRRGQPLLMAPFAVAFGTAASIKPLVIPFPFLLLLLACLELRRRGRPLAPYLTAALLAACIPPICVMAFLLRQHVLTTFIALLRGLVVYYTNNNNAPYGLLWRLALGRFLLSLFLAALLISLLRGTWKHWEIRALALGTLFGLVLFIGQRKGWSYHKGTLIAFVLLWIAIQLYLGLRRIDLAFWIAAASLLLCSLFIGYSWLRIARIVHYNEATMLTMQGQLTSLGGAALSGHIQCLEVVSGCINDLLRMRLVQSTGYLGDYVFFLPEHVPALDVLRADFLAKMHARPPRVIVLAPLSCLDTVCSYAQVANWPPFVDFLSTGYTLAIDQREADGMIGKSSYRIYLRR